MKAPITILIVDDEEIVQKLIRVALNGFGDLIILEAKNGPEGLKTAREYYGNIDLLISDVVMPGRINGAEMAAQLCQSRPNMKVVLMSGYPPETVAMKPDWQFIQKPFRVAEVRERIGHIFTDHWIAA